MTVEIWNSALQHGVIALMIQLMLWPLFGLWSAGGIAVALFLGREIAQHEYKGSGPKIVAWDYGLLHHWTLDSCLDIALPFLFCLCLALAVWAARHWHARHQ
ncbi:hypothetical protein [Cobetia crustatorum]|uniref:hypothetical protein n=2 Tax=Halomonadaceae TaxID=28256 RepID=UPI00046A5D02|nr:hypothetical protein [Cobetia crustatorum]